MVGVRTRVKSWREDQSGQQEEGPERRDEGRLKNYGTGQITWDTSKLLTQKNRYCKLGH